MIPPIGSTTVPALTGPALTGPALTSPEQARTGPRRPLPATIKAAVFDCDGLLVDSEPRWRIAEAAVFAAEGQPYGPAEMERYLGRAMDECCRDMARIFGRPGDEQAISDALLAEVGIALAEGADPMPGAADLLARMAAKVPIAVASNSPRSALTAALTGSGLAALVPITVSADDVTHPKPAPDLYLAACATLGVEPQHAVAFEDSVTGAAAARAAGLYVIAVPSEPGRPIEHDWMLDSLTDPALTAWVDGL